MNVLEKAKAIKAEKAQTQKGFTIIEVVLVLAIAGLIFLMVFIALPALQRNQRDTQRKGDMGRLSSAIISYTNSNRGKIPVDAAGYSTFVTNYLTTGGDSFIDPSGATTGQGDTYVMQSSTEADLMTGATPKNFANSQNIIYFSNGYICGTSSSSIAVAGNRKVAFRMVLEGGGYHCVNN